MEMALNDPNTTPSTTSSPLHCLIGGLVAGAMAYGMYNLMTSIATKFATTPIHTDNDIVYRITIAVRTLVVGATALGMGVFGLVTVGLLALMVQLLIQSTKKERPSNN
jgi:Protein of unknown function (DUF3082)